MQGLKTAFVKKEDNEHSTSFPHLANRVFHPAQFRELGHQVIDLLASHLEKMTGNKENEPVLPKHHAESLLAEWPLIEGALNNENIAQTFSRIINQSLHLHHPGYIAHQTAPVLPFAALCQTVTSLLNNAMGIFEMGPVHVVMEKRIIEWLCQKIGYAEKASGFLTSGGSLANFTGLMAARQVKSPGNAWEEGTKNQAILISEHAHYSAKRAIQMMGLPKKNIILVKTNAHYQIDSLENLAIAYEEALAKQLLPIAVVGSACNTGPGTFDKLSLLAEFCVQKNLWLHVDAAHGATTLLSEKYQHLLEGIEKADSITWDLHKLFLMPSLATAILFKHVSHSYEAFKQDAPYLLYKDAKHSEEKDGWHENIKRTFECTKPSMALGLFLSLSFYGESFFAEYVTYTYDLAQAFAEKLATDKHFELLIKPQSNIVCFRYLPSDEETEMNALQEMILQSINESGRFFIVKTVFEGKVYLRTTLMNPLTTLDDLVELMDRIKIICSLGEA